MKSLAHRTKLYKGRSPFVIGKKDPRYKWETSLSVFTRTDIYLRWNGLSSIAGCHRLLTDYKHLAGGLGHSRSVSRSVFAHFSFLPLFLSFRFLFFFEAIVQIVQWLYNVAAYLFCTLSSSSRSPAGALDEEYVSTCFWPHLKGGI